jgi:hypothetical protein
LNVSRITSLGEYDTIVSHGPHAEYVPTAELITPANEQSAIAASGNWTSTLITAMGLYDFVLGITLSQAGTLTLLRFIDDAGQVALDSGQSQTLTANAAAVLVVNDGKPCASYQVKISDTASAAAVSKFAALLASH